jgi:hypothetical protein
MTSLTSSMAPRFGLNAAQVMAASCHGVAVLFGSGLTRAAAGCWAIGPVGRSGRQLPICSVKRICAARKHRCRCPFEEHRPGTGPLRERQHAIPLAGRLAVLSSAPLGAARWPTVSTARRVSGADCR